MTTLTASCPLEGTIKPFERFLTLQGYSGSTVRAYSHAIARLSALLGNPPLDMISRSDLEEVKGRLLIEQGNCPGYVAAQMFGWRCLWAWLAATQGFENVTKGLPVPPSRPGKQRFLTSPELSQALSRLRSLPCSGGRSEQAQTRALAAVFQTGARSIEVRRARAGDVDLKGRTITLRGKGRGEKLRTIGLTRRQVVALRLHLKFKPPGDALFLNRDGKALTKAAVDALFRKLSRALGTRISSHVIRRSVCDHVCRNSGVDVAQGLLGHSDIKTTLGSYRSVQEHETRAALETI